MNKEYYNNYIDRIIKDLIEEKDMYSEDISVIATHLSEYYKENEDLDALDLIAINEKRNNMATLYGFIDDLEKLKIK